MLELGLVGAGPRVQRGASAAPRLGPGERVWEVAFPYTAVEMTSFVSLTVALERI